MANTVDVSKFQIGFTSELTGIAVDPESNSLVLLNRLSQSSDWKQSHFELQDMRSVRKVKTEPDEYFVTNSRGGAHGIGASLGVGMRNRAARKKAEAETGILVNLRSIETPTHFIKILDEKDRDTAFEALSQICESGGVKGRFNQISAARGAAMSGASQQSSSTMLSDDPARKFIPSAKSETASEDLGMSTQTGVRLLLGVAVIGLILWALT